MSLLRRVTRRARRGALLLVAVASGLLIGAAFAEMGAACGVSQFNVCDQPDGTELPPICFDASGDMDDIDAPGDAP